MCWVLRLVLGFWCEFWFLFYFRNHFAEEERAGCSTLSVVWLSVFCVSTYRYRWLVCSLRLWYFLVTLTYLLNVQAVLTDVRPNYSLLRNLHDLLLISILYLLLKPFVTVIFFVFVFRFLIHCLLLLPMFLGVLCLVLVLECNSSKYATLDPTFKKRSLMTIQNRVRRSLFYYTNECCRIIASSSRSLS